MSIQLKDWAVEFSTSSYFIGSFLALLRYKAGYTFPTWHYPSVNVFKAGAFMYAAKKIKMLLLRLLATFLWSVLTGSTFKRVHAASIYIFKSKSNLQQWTGLQNFESWFFFVSCRIHIELQFLISNTLSGLVFWILYFGKPFPSRYEHSLSQQNWAPLHLRTLKTFAQRVLQILGTD